TREGDEAEYILRNVPWAAPGPPGWNEPGRSIEFFYQNHHLLVLDEYLERVLALLGDEASIARGGGLVAGVTLLRLHMAKERQPDVFTAIEEIRESIGADVAAPNHFVALSPAGWCPAGDPCPVPCCASPYPPPPPCAGSGNDVRVVVLDGGIGP